MNLNCVLILGLTTLFVERRGASSSFYIDKDAVVSVEKQTFPFDAVLSNDFIVVPCLFRKSILQSAES